VPDGRLFLLMRQEGGDAGPKWVVSKELHDAFTQGWSIKCIEPSWHEVRPDLKDWSFSEGGQRAWFAVVRRVN
jgi:hypothetical protein